MGMKYNDRFAPLTPSLYGYWSVITAMATPPSPYFHIVALILVRDYLETGRFMNNKSRGGNSLVT